MCVCVCVCDRVCLCPYTYALLNNILKKEQKKRVALTSSTVRGMQMRYSLINIVISCRHTRCERNHTKRSVVMTVQARRSARCSLQTRAVSSLFRVTPLLQSSFCPLWICLLCSSQMLPSPIRTSRQHRNPATSGEHCFNVSTL